jgi:hypothetical protein
VPTWATVPQFDRDFAALSSDDKRKFRIAVAKFVEDLKAGRKPREGLRVKKYQSLKGALEMSWAPDGRAYFKYGKPVREGERHVIWLAIGDHTIF